MNAINVDGSAARLLANRSLAKSGYCLHYCWLAISRGIVHYITGGSDTAYHTWLAVPADHQHASRDVPKDFPAFLGPKLLSRAGDVIISNGTRNTAGELLFAATDWPRPKQVGLCTLAQREKQTGRKFVGWASSMGGHELTSTITAGETGTPITEKLTQRGAIDMPELYGTTMPAGTPVAQKYLDVNKGLAPGLPTYMLLGGSAGTPFNAKVTQDQKLASQWAKQLAPTLDNPSEVIVAASWGWADQMWDQALAPLAIAGGVGGGGIDYDQLAAAIAKSLPKTITLS